MNSRAKIKIISGLIATMVVAMNLVFVPIAFAAVSGSEIVSMTNNARIEAGLKPYSVDSRLNSSAYTKAQDILDEDYFAHYSPQGTPPWFFIKKAGYSYTYAGENLAINFDSSSATFNAWMASPTHKANILDKDFTQIGVAVLSGDYQGRETTVVVQHFGAPTKSQIASAKAQEKTSPEKSQTKEAEVKLDLTIAQTPDISDEKISEVFWFSSPALFAFRVLS